MQSVTLNIPLADGAQTADLFGLEDQLAAALKAAKAGEVDGNEVGRNAWTVFMYGKSADAIFQVIRPVLRACPLSHGATVVKQFGGPLAQEQTRELWQGRFRITQRARKPGKRPRVGDVLEFDCKGGVGHAHAVHRATAGGMRGGWVVSILEGIREPGSWPDIRKEICRLWMPLGAATAQGDMRVVGNVEPASRESPPSFMLVSFNLIQACVEHGHSLHDEDFLESILDQRS